MGDKACLKRHVPYWVITHALLASSLVEGPQSVQPLFCPKKVQYPYRSVTCVSSMSNRIECNGLRQACLVEGLEVERRLQERARVEEKVDARQQAKEDR